MKKININILTGYIVLIVVATLTSIVGISITRKIQKENQPIIKIQPSQYPDYDAIKGEKADPQIIKLDITHDYINDKSATIDFDGIDKKLKVSGKFSRAYLYIEGMVDYKRPLTSWDDFYFKMNGMGGHLVSNDDNSLPVPPSEKSQYLYDLRSISYFSSPTEKIQKINEHKNINLFNLLQDSAELNIHVSLSSARSGRVMKEVSIYYECVDGSDCSIK